MKTKWSINPLFFEAIDKQTGEVYKDGFEIGFIAGGAIGIINEETTERKILELRLITEE